jgi:hypothetical protein
MVYGTEGRSLQADAIVWDAGNYPSISQNDGRIVFQEAARLVVEVKTRWSDVEWSDIRAKCRALRDLGTAPRTMLEDRVEVLEENVRVLADGIRGIDRQEPTWRRGGLLDFVEPYGAPPRFAAVVLSGGERFTVDAQVAEGFAHGNDEWPDLVLLLGAGRVVWKIDDAAPGDTGRVQFIEAGLDSLLVFCGLVLDLLALGSSHTEEPFYLGRYCESVLGAIARHEIEYQLPRGRNAPAIQVRRNVPADTTE